MNLDGRTVWQVAAGDGNNLWEVDAEALGLSGVDGRNVQRADEGEEGIV